MKLKSLTCIVSLCACLFTANAAVVSVGNALGDISTGITEADGLPGAAVTTRGFNTTEAFMTFGYFSITDSQVQSATSASSLYSSLVRIGNNVGSFTAANFGANGFATAAMSSNVQIAGSQFENKNIYVFVANAANAAAMSATTQVFVMKLNQTFLAEWDNLAANTVSFNNGDGTVLLGGYNNYSFRTRTADGSVGPAWNTVSLPIPETSTSLLGALGALALLRRRRN